MSNRSTNVGSGGRAYIRGKLFQVPNTVGADNQLLPIDPNPFVQNDQPNPVLRLSSMVAVFLAGCAGVSNTLPLTSVTKERAAVVTKYEPRKVQQPDLVPNLLTTTLAPVVAANPFTPVDQPNPVRKLTYSVQPEVPINILPLVSVTQIRALAATKIEPRRVLQTDIPSNTLPLSSVAVAAPFYQTDQPNPILRLRTVQPEVSANLAGTVLAPVVTNPFVLSNQPNPLIRKVLQVDPVPDLLTSTLNQAATHAAFNQTDQPNPVLRTRTVQPEVPPNLLINYPVAVVNPFGLDDQPNPVLRVRTVQPEIPINILPLTGATRVRAVAATKIEPRRVQQPPDPPNYLPLKYFTPPENPLPINRHNEWYTPRQRFDWLSQSLHVIAYGAGTPTVTDPFKQREQPNPTINRKVLQTDIPYNFTILNSPRIVTRGLYALRVTKAPPQQPQLPSNILPLTAPVGNPFSVQGYKDQPNPVLRVRTVQPEITRNVLPLVTPPLPPFYQNEQPNPVRLKPGYWVFQFDRLNIALQPSAWSGISDSQTPAWIGTGEICTADSTLGTADTTLLTADLSCANSSWTPVVDSDTPAWVAIPDAQAPGWSAVSDSDTPGWTVITTAPGGTSSS